jgi:hypothetical protein
MDSAWSAYVQPIAAHVSNPERLLLRDQEGTFHLWHGTGDAMVAIPEGLASWLMHRPEMLVLSTPHMWFDVASLPLAVEKYDNEWSVAD